MAKVQYGMKGVCAGHVWRRELVDGARIGAQNATLCLCNTTLGIHLRVHGAHNVRYKSPSGAQKLNIPYWAKVATMQNVDKSSIYIFLVHEQISFVIYI